jgi:hypothetical protein
MFMSKEPKQRLNLGDLIMSKIKEKETEVGSTISGGFRFSGCFLFLETRKTGLDERIVRVYERLSLSFQFFAYPLSVGEILSKYRSGKLPKAFKIIASLRRWEEVYCCPAVPTARFSSSHNRTLGQQQPCFKPLACLLPTSAPAWPKGESASWSEILFASAVIAHSILYRISQSSDSSTSSCSLVSVTTLASSSG